jgi:hypothetical protein
VATISCLLSGLEVFSESFQEHLRYLRVVRGIHGFHVYATEYWTDLLLSYAVSADSLDNNPLLFELAHELANKLDQSTDVADINDNNNDEGNAEVVDERLNAIESYPTLHKQVRKALTNRSLKKLEFDLFPSKGKLKRQID